MPKRTHNNRRDAKPKLSKETSGFKKNNQIIDSFDKTLNRDSKSRKHN